MRGYFRTLSRLYPPPTISTLFKKKKLLTFAKRGQYDAKALLRETESKTNRTRRWRRGRSERKKCDVFWCQLA